MTKKSILTKAIAKGVAHATVIPLMIFVLTNMLIEGKYGGVAAIVYIIIVSILYNLVLKDKDISKIAFNKTIFTIVSTIFAIYAIWFMIYVTVS